MAESACYDLIYHHKDVLLWFETDRTYNQTKGMENGGKAGRDELATWWKNRPGVLVKP